MDTNPITGEVAYNPTQARPPMPWRVWFRLKWHAVKRCIPRLVWPYKPVWVRITFTEQALGTDISPLFEVERRLRDLGLNFDTGAGAGGRDWEWDWSLSGPVKVTFVPKRRLKRKALKGSQQPAPTQFQVINGGSGG